MSFDNLHFVADANSRLPKFRQISRYLEQYLRNNELPPGTRLPGDRQLAEQLGLAPVTVFKGLNELVREGVLTRQVGSGTYVARRGAARVERIGIICHDHILQDSAYLSPLTEYFCKYWESRGCRILTMRGTPDEYEKLIDEFKLSGILVMVPKESFFEKIAAMTQQGVPVVSIGFAHPDYSDIAFGNNHEKTAEEAVSYLHSLGHTRIGCIESKIGSVHNTTRLRGYAKGMFNAHLPSHPDWLIHGDAADAEEKLRQLFTIPDHPTAFLVMNIHFIISIYRFLGRLNMRIPQDISLIGFDDAPFLTEIDPPVTVFKQNLEEMAAQATAQLENMIYGRPLNSINHNNFCSKLTLRGSCHPSKQEVIS